MAQEKVQTIAITNFGGRLTRVLNGDMNSGFAKFDTSFGYDPFTKPMNLTWLAQPTSIAGILGDPTIVGKQGDVIVAGVNYASGGAQVTSGNTFALGAGNMIYRISEGSNQFSVIGLSSIGGSYAWGGSLQFFGQTQKLYVTDNNSIRVTGSVTGLNIFSLDNTSSVIASSNVVNNTFHPLKKFGGKLIFGNGPSIGAIDATGTVISSVFTVNNSIGNQFSQIFPPLPDTQWVRDLDVSPDGNYLYVVASSILPEALFLESPLPTIFALFERGNQVTGEGGVYGWNGVDSGITTALSVPTGTPVTQQVFLQENKLFFKDSFGAALGNAERKLLTLPGSKVPLPNAVDSNGNFLTWATPETTKEGKRVMALYYFGSLDEENPQGLYRLLRYTTPLADGGIYQVPYQSLVRTAYITISSSVSNSSILSLGSHLISTYSVSNSVYGVSSVGTGRLLQFDVSSSAAITPQLGIYETQTQLFSKKVQIVQIRVYTEPTISGNGFQVDIVGSDGAVIANGTFNYSFVAGTDINKLQGSLQRINFNMNASPGYAFGIRVTNTGSTNMTIKKIEIDVTQEGR